MSIRKPDDPGATTVPLRGNATAPTEPEVTDTTSAADIQVAPPERLAERVRQITDEVHVSAELSDDPDRFERAVRAAFEFLGFRAEWIGGSGKTDVLLDALIGPDSYRVTVDCKTSKSGSISDHQVDWVTLEEHRVKHDADHIALVGPNPSGGRLHDRAEQHDVAVIPAEQLIGLCRQHARTALTLDDYRHLFDHGGAVDTQAVDEQADEDDGLLRLARAICATIRDRSESFGLLTARDLYLILADQPEGAASDQDHIQAVLDTLSGPLLRVLIGTPESGYRATTSYEVSVIRLQLVGTSLARGTVKDE